MWKCSDCGYENSSFDTVCFVCKKPCAGSSTTKSTTKTSSSGSHREHMTVSHYVATGVLLLSALLFCLCTPTGQAFIGNIRLGLVMDFKTVRFNDLFNDLSGLATILIIVGAVWLGIEEGGWGGVIGGGLCGFLVYTVFCFLWMLLVSYVLPFIVNTGTYVTVVIVCLAFAIGCAVAIVNYGKNFILYFNPYPKTRGIYDDGIRRYYEDKNANREEYGHRSYFFGPGFFSINETIKNSWKANFQLIGNVCEWLRNRTLDFVDWLLWIPGVPFFIFYLLYCLGCLLCTYFLTQFATAHYIQSTT